MTADIIAILERRNVLDERLIAEGHHAELVAAYYESVILPRCIIRLKGHPDAHDVANAVALRLLQQLRRSTRFTAPFGVIVRKRVDFELRDYWAAQKTLLHRYGTSLEGIEEPWRDDPDLDIFDADEIDRLLGMLSETDREILELVYIEGIAHEEAARRLGIKRNAVDARLHRAKRNFRRVHGG